MNQLTVKKCGIRFDPPAIVLIYSQQTLFKSKLRIRTIPAKNLHTPAGAIASKLKSCDRHKKYLDQIPEWQLEKLINILKDGAEGMKREDLIKKAKEKLFINSDEDLNKVDDETLQIKKAVMNKTFEKNRKKPGDADFTYDIEVDFNIEGNRSHEWDDTSEVEEL